MALPDPITRKEMYLNKAATGSGSVPPEPVTREEMYLAEIAKGGGGASSLADLSDVEINPSSTSADNLLRFNAETDKWENVSVERALLGYEYTDTPGSLALSDYGNVFVVHRLSVDINDTFGQTFSQLLQAAIAYGQYQADNLDPTTFRFLVNSAISNTYYNSNLSYAVYSDNLLMHSLMHSFQLVGASADFAVWSGVILNGTTFYRITFAVMSPDDTTPASIVVKAEQLMTYTEPT